MKRGGREEMSEEAELRVKLKRAAHMLFFRTHSKPGVKGWELKKGLGRNYLQVIDLLNKELEKIGLRVEAISQEGEKPKGEQDLLYSSFFVTFKDPPDWPEIRGSGWRIDEMAALTACLSLILSRGGKVKRKEIDELLEKKIPSWRARTIVERFFRMGYLSLGEEDEVIVGWRSRVEIDLQKLMNLLLGREAGTA